MTTLSVELARFPQTELNGHILDGLELDDERITGRSILQILRERLGQKIGPHIIETKDGCALNRGVFIFANDAQIADLDTAITPDCDGAVSVLVFYLKRLAGG